jgi:hypothetical protein
MKYAVHLCSFSVGLDELPPKRRNRVEVLRILKTKGRFSEFEVNRWVGATLTAIFREGLVEAIGDAGYPWTNVRLTEAGEALIARESP